MAKNTAATVVCSRRHYLLLLMMPLVFIPAIYYPLCIWRTPCIDPTSTSSLESLEQMMCCSWSITVMQEMQDTETQHDTRDPRFSYQAATRTNTLQNTVTRTNHVQDSPRNDMTRTDDKLQNDATRTDGKLQNDLTPTDDKLQNDPTRTDDENLRNDATGTNDKMQNVTPHNPALNATDDHQVQQQQQQPQQIQEQQQMQQQQQHQQKQQQPQEQLQQQKIILFWTPFFSDKDYSFGFGHEPFITHNCPVSNCMTTEDKSLQHQASAVVFHLRDMSSRFPSPRFENQSYVFFLLESPMHQGRSLHQYNGVFNMTMTYRRDSDIFMPYGDFTRGFSALPDKEVTEIVRNKKKLVAWFVSNCGTPSRREWYVRELQKHIDVDIYGGCGHFKCPRSEDCHNMVQRDYKFYISFENSICEDYVTEKLFGMLSRYVVPVVYGGGNYTALAPPHSVINVRDYASPKHLADYLRVLDADEAQYRKYFNWKQRYVIRASLKESISRGFCTMCEMINAPHPPTKIRTNLQKWWETDAHCDNGIINKLGLT